LVSQANGRSDAVEINRLFRAGLHGRALLLDLVFGLVGAGLAYYYDLFGQAPEVTENRAKFYTYSQPVEHAIVSVHCGPAVVRRPFVSTGGDVNHIVGPDSERIT
jgi:hypothetical protein